MNPHRHRADWLLPLGLVALAFIPLAAGGVRLALLAAGGPLTPHNERFLHAPLPVLAHILSVTLFSLLGAFQFAPQLRRQHPGWHRAAGRVVVVAGAVAATSGLWMTQTYTIVPADNALLHGLRLFFGTAMLVAIARALVAVRHGDIPRHQAWMCRAYAIGLGAGTQALIQLPPLLLVGEPGDMARALMMGAGWVLNLAVAEASIRGQHAAG